MPPDHWWRESDDEMDWPGSRGRDLSQPWPAIIRFGDGGGGCSGQVPGWERRVAAGPTATMPRQHGQAPPQFNEVSFSEASRPHHSNVANGRAPSSKGQTGGTHNLDRSTLACRCLILSLMRPTASACRWGSWWNCLTTTTGSLMIRCWSNPAWRVWAGKLPPTASQR